MLAGGANRVRLRCSGSVQLAACSTGTHTQAANRIPPLVLLFPERETELHREYFILKHEKRINIS